MPAFNEEHRAYRTMHRVPVPAPVARMGIAPVQNALRGVATTVVVHEEPFRHVVPDATVIPHGIERVTPDGRAAARRRLGLDGRLKALCFGFLAPYKGLETALEAGERAGRDVLVVVAGGPVLASGLGPVDMTGYVSQQLRWARGCLSAIPRVVRSGLPINQRLQYLLSAGFFLTGWTFLVYMAMPVIRILTGAQPIATQGADQFLLVFLPYFGLALATLAATGTGAYGFDAYSLLFANWWVHVSATIALLRGRPARFVVTPKEGASGRQPRAVLPALVCIVVLVAVGAYGLLRARCTTTEPSSEDLAVAAGRRFLDRYVETDGRVVRRDQGGDVVSEGQAYGMLVAVGIDDRQTFERIWSWTRDKAATSNTATTPPAPPPASPSTATVPGGCSPPPWWTSTACPPRAAGAHPPSSTSPAGRWSTTGTR